MGRQEGIDGLLAAVQHIVHDDGAHRHPVRPGRRRHGAGGDAQARASELGVADYVTFTGRVPDDELLAMLNTADVCVNPDVANDMNDKSTMNKIMEYMALGKPIVQFDLTEGRVSAQDASLYAQRNDPIDMARQAGRAAGRCRAAAQRMGDRRAASECRDRCWPGSTRLPRLLRGLRNELLRRCDTWR